MTDTVFYMPSCDTCRKILSAIPEHPFVLRDIKKEPPTPEEIDELKQLAGSYEALFSRKAQLYKSLGLKEKNLTEQDFRNYLLEHYTFLQRPVFVIGQTIFIGNRPETTAKVIAFLG